MILVFTFQLHSYLIKNVQGQQFINANSIVDITPQEAFEIIDYGMKQLENIAYVVY